MRANGLPKAFLAMFMPLMPVFCFAQQPAASQSAADPNSQLCTIAGTVVSANTGEALKKAHVVMSREGVDPEEEDSSNQPLNAVTDATGRFSIDKIPAGKYDLAVHRDNYLPSRYGQDQLDKPGAILSLTPGQKIPGLLFRLHRTAIITGHVRDDDGDPIRGANVQALGRTTFRGKTTTASVGSDRTNDLGEYRMIDLSPGHYSIRAEAQGCFLFSTRGTSQHDADYLPTFYPGTTERSRASTLDVKSGDEISGIDLFLAPKALIRAYRIRGRVLNSLTESQELNIVVMVLPRLDREQSLAIGFGDRKNATPDPKTGAFEINGVVPGEYIASAIGFSGSKTHTATQSVDVLNSDVEGVVLALTNGIDIPGRVAFEGKAQASSAGDTRVRLIRQESEGLFVFGGGQHATVQADGSFVLKEVAEGKYSIEVSSKCRECYLKSAKGNGVDLIQQGLEVRAGNGPSSIAILYSSNTGTVTGSVTNQDDLPAPGPVIVLVPDNASHQKPEQYQSGNTTLVCHQDVTKHLRGRRLMTVPMVTRSS